MVCQVTEGFHNLARPFPSQVIDALVSSSMKYKFAHGFIKKTGRGSGIASERKREG